MAIDYSLSAIPKVRPSLGKRFVKGLIARCRARKARTDAAYAAGIRELVAARDGFCRHGYDVRLGDRFARCSGPSEWAHFGEHKRFKTRGMAPEDRHTTAGSLMLCRSCHMAYDRGVLLIIAKTGRLCDGPLLYQDNRR